MKDGGIEVDVLGREGRDRPSVRNDEVDDDDPAVAKAGLFAGVRPVVGRAVLAVDPPNIDGLLTTVSSSRTRLVDATTGSEDDCEESMRRTNLCRKKVWSW